MFDFTQYISDKTSIPFTMEELEDSYHYSGSFVGTDEREYFVQFKLRKTNEVSQLTADLAVGRIKYYLENERYLNVGT